MRLASARSLWNNSVGPEGAKALGEALKSNSALKDLNVAGSSINSNIGGAEGAKHIAEALKTNTTLTSINLQSNVLDAPAKQPLRQAAGKHLQLKL